MGWVSDELGTGKTDVRVITGAMTKTRKCTMGSTIVLATALGVATIGNGVAMDGGIVGSTLNHKTKQRCLLQNILLL